MCEDNFVIHFPGSYQVFDNNNRKKRTPKGEKIKIEKKKSQWKEEGGTVVYYISCESFVNLFS